MTAPILIAVDGGGTGSRYAMRRGADYSEVIAGPANVSSDFDGALANLRLGLEKLGLSAGELQDARICMGLAGVLDEADAARVLNALKFPHLKVLDDRAIAVRGAFLSSGLGALAGIGTGSYVACLRDGAVQFAGGWGLALGDEASGAWLGREALRAALMAHEGAGLQSTLVAELLKGGPARIMRDAALADPAWFGQIAPLVVNASVTGDKVAMNLLNRGAAYLSDTLRRIGWTDGVPLVLTGSLGPVYKPYLPADMRANLKEQEGSARDGAFAYAAEMP